MLENGKGSAGWQSLKNMLCKTLWTCRTGYVILTITRQKDGKLRNSASICGIGKGVYLLQSDQIVSMAHSASSQGVQEDHTVAVKRLGPETVVCFPYRRL